MAAEVPGQGLCATSGPEGGDTSGHERGLLERAWCKIASLGCEGEQDLPATQRSSEDADIWTATHRDLAQDFSVCFPQMLPSADEIKEIRTWLQSTVQSCVKKFHAAARKERSERLLGQERFRFVSKQFTSRQTFVNDCCDVQIVDEQVRQYWGGVWQDHPEQSQQALEEALLEAFRREHSTHSVHLNHIISELICKSLSEQEEKISGPLRSSPSCIACGRRQLRADLFEWQEDLIGSYAMRACRPANAVPDLIIPIELILDECAQQLQDRRTTISDSRIQASSVVSPHFREEEDSQSLVFALEAPSAQVHTGGYADDLHLISCVVLEVFVGMCLLFSGRHLLE